MLSRFLRPLPLSAYAGIFIGLTVALFAVLGWLTLSQLDSAREEISQVQRNSAAQEIQESISQVEVMVRRSATGLADWDELHQQLGNPTYYAYWREHRLMKSDLLPPHIRSAQVYSQAGTALAQISDNGLPARLENNDHSPYLLQENGTVDLVYIQPVYNKSGETIAGYIGLRVDFRALFLSTNRFHFLDEHTLHFNTAFSDRLELTQIARFIDYSLLVSQEAKTVQSVMETAVMRLAITIGLLAAGFYVMLASLLGIPLRRLLRDIEHMRSDSPMPVSERLTAMPISELEQVRQSLNEYQSQLKLVHSNLDEKNKALWEMAHHDPLTGTFNRRAFDLDWNGIRSTLSGQRLQIAFVLFDCNHFKAINDTYGHQAGDQVIASLAQCICDGLRSGDRLYRLGGDEFAAVLINCNRDSAREIAERCAKLVRSHDFSAVGVKEPVRVSVGISLGNTEDAETLTSLQWQADIAMYRAKRPESTHIEIYSESCEDGVNTLISSSITSAVYSMLKDGLGIEMHYQPIVRLASGQIEYYEALVRIRHDSVLIMPDLFFPLVETRDLHFELDNAVLDAILKDLESGMIPEATGVSINLSGQSLVRPDTIHKLEKFKPFRSRYRLLLEVTETSLIKQLEAATDVLEQARKSGFSIALDDFGSGYSSLRYLANMPVDIVKFDISMIRQLGDGGQSRLVIEQLAGMISEAGYSLVAEGIESRDLRELVEHAGFHYGQGYLFGRPARRMLKTPDTGGTGKATGFAPRLVDVNKGN